MFSNCSIAAFAEGFLVFFWPLTAYPLIFFKESDEVGLFFLFYPQNFFSFSPERWFKIRLSLVPGQVFFVFFLVPWILVDIRLVYIYIYIYIYIFVCCLSKEWIKIYFKIGRPTKRFVCFWIYLFCSYICVKYVSSSLLSTENICGIQSC